MLARTCRRQKCKTRTRIEAHLKNKGHKEKKKETCNRNCKKIRKSHKVPSNGDRQTGKRKEPSGKAFWKKKEKEVDLLAGKQGPWGGYAQKKSELGSEERALMNRGVDHTGRKKKKNRPNGEASPCLGLREKSGRKGD